MDRILRDYVDILHAAMEATAQGDHRPDTRTLLRSVEDYASLVELVLAAQLRQVPTMVDIVPCTMAVPPPPPPKPTERDM